MPEQLKKLAKLLREAAEKRAEVRDVKCAQVIQASIGLTYLRNKLER